MTFNVQAKLVSLFKSKRAPGITIKGIFNVGLTCTSKKTKEGLLIYSLREGGVIIY